jgi:hypothetical protein
MIRWVDRLLDRLTRVRDDTKKKIVPLHYYIICIFTTRPFPLHCTIDML